LNYLDWFQNGKRHYEYLKLYTVLSDRLTKAEREANRESLKLAQQIRNQRENQLITEPQGITPAHKCKQSVIAYLEANSTTKGGEMMTEHFRKFLGGRDFQIQNLTKEHLQDFSEYLTQNLNGNTANAYFSKLRTLIKRAIAEKIVAADLLLDVEAPQETGNHCRLPHNRGNFAYCTERPQPESKARFPILVLLRYALFRYKELDLGQHYPRF
jgi:hypothetical protein